MENIVVDTVCLNLHINVRDSPLVITVQTKIQSKLAYKCSKMPPKNLVYGHQKLPTEKANLYILY